MSVPERIGRYRVQAAIGRGGMGAVYRAHDPLLDRLVAIKVMTEGGEAGSEAHERFLREAQSAARLNHPNVTTVYELGQDQGQTFIVMELLEGEPLSRLIARVPPLPLRQKLGIMIQVCEGLGFAHQRGVVHRDVKPANVFVLQNGQVKILDFGIARTSASELTRTGLLMGTPNYMSPEQARGRRTDTRSDIFSVGVVFYELLTRRKPFVGEDYFETLDKVRNEEPVSLQELVPGLPPALVRAVERALAKDPSARYQTLESLRLDLLAVPEVLLVDTATETLRDAVDRKLAEVIRLHRNLVAVVGSTALGDETLPLADPAAAEVGLETMLRDLEGKTERLRALARLVEQLEPGVIRGIAAFERGAYAEAIAELDLVLREIPSHERARDYRERARLEQFRERTLRSSRAADSAIRGLRPDELAAGREPMGATAVATPPVATPPAATPPVATPPVATPPVATPRSPRLPELAGPAGVPAPAPPETWAEVTQSVSGRRPRLVLAIVATVAAVGGGTALFFWPPPSRPAAVVTPDPAVPPSPAPPVPVPPAGTTPAPPLPTPPVPAPPAGTTPAPPPEAPSGPPVAKPPAQPPGGGSPPKAPVPAPRPPAATPSPGPPVSGRPTPEAKPLTAEEKKVIEDALTLAQLFQTRGDATRALREFRRVLALDPNHAEARQGVAEVEASLKGKQ